MGYFNFWSPKIFAKIVYLNLGIRENSDKTFVAPMETASFFFFEMAKSFGKKEKDTVDSGK